MARCVIVCAGERGAMEFDLRPDDFVICCDEGLNAAREIGLHPDLLLGDFDSIETPLPQDVLTLRFPIEKDDTDSMLAVREGLRRGFTEFVLLFSLGGRLDHTIANIQALRFLLEHGGAGVLVGPRDEVRLLQNGSLTLPHREDCTLSVFALDGAARGVTLEGMQYPLCDATLYSGFPIGAGNHILAQTGKISVRDGMLLVIRSAL